MKKETTSETLPQRNSVSESRPVVADKANMEEKVPDLINIVSEIVDPNLEISTDPLYDGVINEIAKKPENRDRMTFCIEKPEETVLPTSVPGVEVLIEHPVCAFARPVNMEFVLVEEKDVLSELAKEAKLMANDSKENSSQEKDSETVSNRGNEVDQGQKVVSDGGGKGTANAEKSTDEGISPVVEQVVRRSQRVYNSLVGPRNAVKVVAPLPLYRRSARIADTSLVQSGKKGNDIPKQVTSLKTKRYPLKRSRKCPSSKMELARRIPVRMESLKMCNPTTVSSSRSAHRKDGKGVKNLPKFLSQFSMKSSGDQKKDSKKTLTRKRTSSNSLEESLRGVTPDKSIQKSASTLSLIKKLKMRDGSDLPTPRRSQRIYNSLNGPEEAVNVVTPITRNCRPSNEVVYNSLVGEDRDVKLEIPKIRKRTIKKSKAAVVAKKSKMSPNKKTNSNQGYSKFSRLLVADTNCGRPISIPNEFSQTANLSMSRSGAHSQPKTVEKVQEQDSSDRMNRDSKARSRSRSSPSVSGVSEASVLVVSSYFTSRRGTQTKVVYSTPPTLVPSTTSKRRPAMSASVQETVSVQRKQGLADRPSSSKSSEFLRSSSASLSERSLRSTSKGAVESIDNESKTIQQVIWFYWNFFIKENLRKLYVCSNFICNFLSFCFWYKFQYNGDSSASI